ncbi:MAG: hypothetical protein PHC57_05265, partial [Candidatus Cloacimonetes bacterium]|nr:hypothetical protein [Candidatus Cloacimonadota bacterium]
SNGRDKALFYNFVILDHLSLLAYKYPDDASIWNLTNCGKKKVLSPKFQPYGKLLPSAFSGNEQRAALGLPFYPVSTLK